MNATPVPAWICPVCGYIHYGAEPPEECPICGALKDQFEAYLETAAAPAVAHGGVLKVVIAGAGIAGVSAAEAARRAAPQAEITLISEEDDLPYYRMSLTRYLAGELNRDQLDLHPQSWYADNGIHLMRGAPITGLNPDARAVTLAGGAQLAYDRLVLATGSQPFVPPFPGTRLRGVTTLRTRLDADTLLAAARSGSEVACIGGGLLGLETAGALARQGAAVTVLENQAWLLPRQLNANAARLFSELLKPLGIHVRTNARTRELVGVGTVHGVQLEDGHCIPAGLVVVSAGVRANTSLAGLAGLTANQGILVDEHMQTSRPEILAAGDVAEFGGMLYGTWIPAQLQGGVAGQNAAGQHAAFHGIPRSTLLKVLGIHLFSTGLIAPTGPDDRILESQDEQTYRGLIFRAGRLAGAILLGDIAQAAAVKQAVEEQRDGSAWLAGSSSAADILQALPE